MISAGNVGILSLLIQFLLLLMVLYAVRLVSGGQSEKHCRTISLAVSLQLISVLIFMSSAMSSFPGSDLSSTSLSLLMWLHHLAGIAVFLLAIYIRLALSGKMTFLGDPYRWMKVTLAIWILTFVGGVLIYLELWQGAALA